MANDSDGQSVTSTSDPRGSALYTMWTERQVRCFAITDHELEMIGRSGKEMALYFSVASASVGYGIDLLIEWQIDSSAVAGGWIIVCGIIALLFTALGIWKGYVYKGLADDIKEMSEDRKGTGGEE